MNIRVLQNFKTPFHSMADLIRGFKKNPEDWRRNLLVISLAQLTALIGLAAGFPFLPLFIRDLGITDPAEANFWSGIVFAGPYLTAMIAVPFWGILGDKYGHKIFAVRAIAGLTVVTLLMGFSENVWHLLILRLLQGVLSGFVAANLAFVAANTPEKRSGFAIGILQSTLPAGNILGPLFGGILADITGIRIVFFIVSFSCFLSTLMLIFFLKEKKHAPRITENSLLANLRYIKGDFEIKKLLLLIIVTQAAILFPNPIFPYFVEQLNAPAEYLSTITGVLIGIVGVFSIITAPAWGKRNDRKDYQNTLFLASVVSGAALVLHSVVDNYYMLIPLRIIVGVFFAALTPTLFTALSKRSPENNKGGIMGISSAATYFGAFVSFTTCSMIASNYGLASIFVISGGMLLLLPSIIFLGNKKTSALSD